MNMDLNGKFVESMVIFPDDVLICRQYVLLRHMAKVCSMTGRMVDKLDNIIDGRSLLQVIGERPYQDMISHRDILDMVNLLDCDVDPKSILSKMVVSLNDSTAPLSHIMLVSGTDIDMICSRSLKFYDHVDKISVDSIVDSIKAKPYEVVNFVLSRPKDLGIAEAAIRTLTADGYKAYITIVDDFTYNKSMDSSEMIVKTNVW